MTTGEQCHCAACEYARQYLADIAAFAEASATLAALEESCRTCGVASGAYDFCSEHRHLMALDDEED